MIPTLVEHLSHFHRHLDESGTVGVLEYFSKLYHRKFINTTGVNIFSREWDVLLVLDACRADSLADVSDEYHFVSNAGKIWSVGASSPEWLSNTFTPDYKDEISNTAYISGNPFTARKLTESDFELLDEVWRYAWDDELGTIPPRPLTDRAIQVMRNNPPGRLIVHYMQPHYPFIPEPTGHKVSLDSFAEKDGSVWQSIKTGREDPDDVYGRYVQNLHYVLRDVELLLSNIEADRVVISSDHGNAFGERWLWGHPGGVQLSAIRRVPWFITTAEDEKIYEPAELNRIDDESLVESRLEVLGYK